MWQKKWKYENKISCRGTTLVNIIYTMLLLSPCENLKIMTRYKSSWSLYQSSIMYTSALFVYVGLHPESFRLIKVYINYRTNPARNRSDPPIRHKRTRPSLDYILLSLSHLSHQQWRRSKGGPLLKTGAMGFNMAHHFSSKSCQWALLYGLTMGIGDRPHFVENYITTDHQICSFPSRQQIRHEKMWKTRIPSQKHDREHTRHMM
jgi:hypothetical protein